MKNLLKIAFWAVVFYLLVSCEKREEFTCGEVQEYRESINPRTNKPFGYYILWDGKNIKAYHTQDSLTIGDTVCL